MCVRVCVCVWEEDYGHFEAINRPLMHDQPTEMSRKCDQMRYSMNYYCQPRHNHCINCTILLHKMNARVENYEHHFLLISCLLLFASKSESQSFTMQSF